VNNQLISPVRQKAANEAAAAEKAEKDRQQKEKADKMKLAEDRHKQNTEALANLLKALVSAFAAATAAFWS
jgi:hypothetical protein